MLDVHPAHHAATTWREFFIHIATIVIGLLIAVGLEQTVELVHRRHEAREARESIKEEIAANIDITGKDVQEFRYLQQRLRGNLDLLNSGQPDSQTLAQLNYQSEFTQRHLAAWNGAKVNGSLALIPAEELADVSDYYESAESVEPAVISFFAQMDTAQAIADHAKDTGRLTALDRQQLLSITNSAMGDATFLAKLFSFSIESLKKSRLQ